MKIHATIVDYPLNLLLILLLSIGSISLQAATSQQDGFDQLWQQILNNSDAINARSSQLASAKLLFHAVRATGYLNSTCRVDILAQTAQSTHLWVI